VAAAQSLADGAMYNAGQSCCSVERIYVHARIHDQFVQALVDTVRSFKMGDPLAADTYLGPLTRAPQIKVLEDQIADAKAKGARCLLGGQRSKGPMGGKGNWFEATVFDNVNHSMALMSDESFGPIIGIQKVNDDSEAIRLMNDTQYGRLLLRQMRKVPDTYKGYINTSNLDRAYARDQTQRDLNYERLGTQRDSNRRSIDLSNRRLDEGIKSYNQNYDFRKDNYDSAKSNMNIANLLGGVNVGVGYLEGVNQRKANQKLTDLLDAQTAFWKSMA
jgi:hypothetical protein